MITRPSSTLVVCCLAVLVTSCSPSTDPPPTSGPAVITTQPASQTVAVGATATFTVVAGGTAPLAYQWTRSGTAITGATSASYTTPATTIGDSGSTFAVTVSNSEGTVTSSDATLTVTTTGGGGGGTVLFHVHGLPSVDPVFQIVLFQDGTGPWVASPYQAAGTYTFNVTDSAGRYGVAVAIGEGGSGIGYLAYGTVSELSELTLPRAFEAPASGQTVVNVLPDLTGDDAAVVSLCEGTASFSAAPAGYQLNIVAGHHDYLEATTHDDAVTYDVFSGDLVAGDSNSTSAATTGGSPADVPVAVTVNNATPSTAVIFAGGINLDCPQAIFNYGFGQLTATSSAAGTATATVHILGKTWPRHMVSASQLLTPFSVSATRYIDSAADQTLTLPALLKLSAHTPASVTPYARPTFDWTPTSGTLIYKAMLDGNAAGGGELEWQVDVTAGYLQGASVATFEFPDFTGADGWPTFQDSLVYVTGAFVTPQFSGAAKNGSVAATLGFVNLDYDQGEIVATGDQTMVQLGGNDEAGLALVTFIGLCPGCPQP